MTFNCRTTLCRLLAICMFLLSFQSAYAGMIGAETALGGPGSASTPGAAVAERSSVADRLQAMGVSRSAAEKRLNLMSDQEVRTLAQKLDSLPAGADGGGWIILAILIVAGLMVWGNMR